MGADGTTHPSAPFLLHPFTPPRPQSSGSITYNGHAFTEFLPVRTAAYVPQADEHIGEMTVRDTFDFAARLQGPAYRAELVKEVVKREAEMGIEPDPVIDAIMKVRGRGGECVGRFGKGKIFGLSSLLVGGKRG